MMKVYFIAQLANSFYIAGAWREISVEGVRTREKSQITEGAPNKGGLGACSRWKFLNFGIGQVI